MKTLFRLIIAAHLLLLFLNTPIAAQWQQTGGPEGGIVWCLASEGSNLFAGTYGGIFLSTNSGGNWSAVNNGLPSNSSNITIFSMAVMGTRLFAGTNGKGVYFSTDDGTNWNPVNTGLPNISTVHSLTVADANIFAGTAEGIFKSTNKGSTWKPLNKGLTDTYVNCLINSGSILFAATGNGVFYCNLTDSVWSTANSGLTNKNINSLAVIGNHLFAGTNGDGVFLSTNNGTSWSSVNTGLPAGEFIIMSLSVSGSNLYAGTNDKFWLSVNNGTTWTDASAGLTNSAVHCLISNGAKLFAGNDAGVYSSTGNGSNWSAVNTGLKATLVQSLLSDASNLYAATNGGGIFLSSNGGINWTPVNNKLPALNIVSLSLKDNKLIAAGNFGVFQSGDKGSSWDSTVTGLPKYSFVNSLLIYKTYLFAGLGGSGGLYVSTDNGTSWKAASSSFPSNTVVSSFAVIDSTLFAATHIGVYSSTDNGKSWSAVNAGLTNTYINCLETVGKNLFAGSNGDGVFLSTDSGKNWGQVNTGINFKSSIYVLKNNSGTLFTGTNSGVYFTRNNGTGWTSANSGFGYSVYVTSLSFTATQVIAGSQGAAVWARPLSDFIIQQYVIITSSSPASGGSTSGGGTFDSESQVTVTATPNTGYSFVQWTEGGNTVSPSSSYSFSASGNRTLVANFIAVSSSKYSVNLTSNPSNGGTTAGGGIYDLGSNVSVTATPNTGYSFLSWTEGTNLLSTNTNYKFVIGSDRTFVANFTINKYSIILSTANGTVTKSPDQTTYNYGTLVTLTATPLNGYNFSGWSGDLTGSANPASVTMNSNKNITAVFTQKTYISNKYSGVPENYLLMQNYPNPFNPGTNIAFGLPVSGYIRLTVYDLLGRTVRLLIDSELSAGYHEIGFDGSNLPSGTYIYQLRAGSFIETKKFLLLK